MCRKVWGKKSSILSCGEIYMKNHNECWVNVECKGAEVEKMNLYHSAQRSSTKCPYAIWVKACLCRK